MPRGVSLYGSLPHQLADRNSFASRLRHILDVRRRSGIATGQQLAVPDVSDPALLVMIHRLPNEQVQATALNFSGRPISGQAESKHFGIGDSLIDQWSDRQIGEIGSDRTVNLQLKPHAGISILVTHPATQRRPHRQGTVTVAEVPDHAPPR